MKVQSSEAIGYRALCVWMVCVRANIEADTLDEPHQKSRNQNTLAKYVEWAQRVGIAEHYSAYERDVIGRPVGEIPNDELHGLGMRLQALGALLWAIGRMEMPPYFETITADLVQPLLPDRDEPIEPFLQTAEARSEAVLRQEQCRATFWNWRCRCDHMRRSGLKPKRGETYKKTVADAAESALRVGLIEAVEEGDVSCDGVPFRDLDEDSFAFAASSTLERHYALNWVCGDAEDWDKVSTTT